MKAFSSWFFFGDPFYFFAYFSNQTIQYFSFLLPIILILSFPNHEFCTLLP